MSDASFNVRKIQESDLEPLADAHIDSIRSIPPDLYSPDQINDWIAPICAQKYRSAIEQGCVFFVAVNEDGELLGFSETHPGEDETHNAAVFVSGKAKRKSVGTALYQAAESQARKSGARCIELNSSLAAIEFYEKNGFRLIEQRESTSDTGQGFPVVLMRKTFS